MASSPRGCCCSEIDALVCAKNTLDNLLGDFSVFRHEFLRLARTLPASPTVLGYVLACSSKRVLAARSHGAAAASSHTNYSSVCKIFAATTGWWVGALECRAVSRQVALGRWYDRTVTVTLRDSPAITGGAPERPPSQKARSSNHRKPRLRATDCPGFWGASSV